MLYALPDKKDVQGIASVFGQGSKDACIGYGYNQAIHDAKQVVPTKIRFRAKRVDNGEEVVGFLAKCRGRWYMLEECSYSGFDERWQDFIEIDPSTLTAAVEMTLEEIEKIIYQRKNGLDSV